jgi:asparagine synthase (glutamine-hydrolysing)
MKRFVGWMADTDAPNLHTQPAAEIYDGCGVLYRGYIANVSALIEETKKRGEVLKSVSHGELFVKAYRWWGDELQSHVLGEYTVAVYNERLSSLFLTHDALGLVPLFYSQKSEGFAFASHLEDLVLLTGVDGLDEEYIADYLATGMILSPRTPYVGVRRLAPGQSLRWINGRLAVRETWDIARIQPVILPNDEEYEECFRVLLREGVTAALRTDGKVWSELSGGLDSSSVVSVAANSGASELEVFSIIYTSSKSADESEWMKAVIRQYALPWHTIDADESRHFSELPDRFCAEPINILPAAGLFRRYQALAESNGVQVVLSGHGGDQIFCGDSAKPYYLADFLPFQLSQLFSALRDWQASSRDKRSLMYLLLKNVIRPFLCYWARRSLSSPDATIPPSWIHPTYLRAMRLNKRSAYQVAPRCRSVGQQYFTEMIWKTGFTAGDECTQPFEFRYPLLYRPLMEFMFGIPWEQKLHPNQDRYLQRRALKGILPEEVRQRSDKAGPAEAEFEGLRNGSPWTECFFSRPRVVEAGYVDARLWHEAVNQVRFGRIVSMRHFVATATMEVWLRQLENVRRATATFMPGPYRESNSMLLETN